MTAPQYIIKVTEVQRVRFVGYTGGEDGSPSLWNLQNLNSRRGLCRFGGYVGNADTQGKYTSVLGTDSNIQSDVKR